jgi:hypothetical protein
MEFVVMQPHVLSQKEFEAYAADATRGGSSYRVKLTCADAVGEQKTKELTLRLGESGHVGTIIGWTAKEKRLSGSNSNAGTLEIHGDLEDGKEIVVSFNLTKAPRGEGVIRWLFRSDLLYDLYATELPGVLVVREKATNKVLNSVDFAATLEGVFYDKLDPK